MRGVRGWCGRGCSAHRPGRTGRAALRAAGRSPAAGRSGTASTSADGAVEFIDSADRLDARAIPWACGCHRPARGAVIAGARVDFAQAIAHAASIPQSDSQAHASHSAPNYGRHRCGAGRRHGHPRRCTSATSHITTKADQSPVTEADVRAEEAIHEVLRARFPGYGFYGEETGQHNPDAESVWLVDPIDGTKSFVRECPFFSTQIALLRAGELVLGRLERAGLRGIRLGRARRGRVPQRQADPRQCHGGACADHHLHRQPEDRWPARRWAGGGFGDLIGGISRIRGYGDFVHYHLLARGVAGCGHRVGREHPGYRRADCDRARGRRGIHRSQRRCGRALGTTSVLATNGSLHARIQAALSGARLEAGEYPPRAHRDFGERVSGTAGSRPRHSAPAPPGPPARRHRRTAAAPSPRSARPASGRAGWRSTVRPRFGFLPEESQHRQLLLRIQMIGGLIEQVDLRILGQQRSHRAAALLAAGEVSRGRDPQSRASPDARQGGLRQAPVLRSVPLQQRQVRVAADQQRFHARCWRSLPRDPGCSSPRRCAMSPPRQLRERLARQARPCRRAAGRRPARVCRVSDLPQPLRPENGDELAGRETHVEACHQPALAGADTQVPRPQRSPRWSSRLQSA